MSDPLITKRLHISGLTPSITPADLQTRLSTFGTVKSLDGFGLLDALGVPRKFGYVTVEGTKSGLARCMNLLSGVTWKGAKLRIGEAKPDYQQRLKRDRSPSPSSISQPTKKRRLPRGVQGIHAPIMDPITPAAVSSGEAKGWRITPGGTVVRPVRMRPEHPLPPLPASAREKARKDKGKGKEERGWKGKGKETEKIAEGSKVKKVKRREPPTRARRRTIDPTRWGSEHLKGAFLGGGGLLLVSGSVIARVDLDDAGESDEDEDESGEDLDDKVESAIEAEADQDGNHSSDAGGEDEVPAQSSNQPVSSPTKPTPAPVPTHLPLPAATTPVASRTTSDLDREKKKSLGILASLFGDKDEWEGKESVGSDVEDTEMHDREGGMGEAEDEISEGDDEVAQVEGEVESDSEEEGEGLSSSVEEAPVVQGETRKGGEKDQGSSQVTKLKDLFAPREEEAGFSLLGHLDLDIEVDEELVDFSQHQLPVHLTISERPAPPIPTYQSMPATQTTRPTQTFDPSLPLFFPLPSSSSTGIHPNRYNPKNTKDFMSIAYQKGWHPSSPAFSFYRTDTEEDIRKKWEENKLELTRDWKRRWREGGKAGRRGGGVGAGE
ncbi:hypothetical protein JAAARDRAFT_190714 [Jaapia argillacea MUCL 33604]|uniref:RRM domain-containing protein n=1 Tax=Jaapia argillacea MUCL 33604 TaxID=933084 RepID=A0A067QHE3_9AGAM|nr:hypothetical protein JAAARDRAFT_190714 [Jaapia argillacea MUCL 33604]